MAKNFSNVHTLQLLSKRVYIYGKSACGNCQQGRHTKCRPRLDGTLCSCSCDTANAMRLAHESAEYASGNTLTLKESIGTFYPVITKDF